jgi:hypothetical protein
MLSQLGGRPRASDGIRFESRLPHFSAHAALPNRPYFPCLTCSAGFVTPSSPLSIKIVSSAFCGPK